MRGLFGACLFGFASMTSFAADPVKTTEFIPTKLRDVHDPVARACQMDQVLTTEQEKRLLRAIETVLDDVCKAANKPARDLPVTVGVNTIRSKVYKTVNGLDLKSSLVVIGSGSLNRVEDSVVLAYGDVTIASATNSVIVAGRLADLGDAVNCIVIAGGVQAKTLSAAAPGASSSESRPALPGQGCVIVARAWVTAVSVSDSIVWSLRAAAAKGDQGATITITKANRVRFLTPRFAQVLGSDANCLTLAAPAWPTH